MKAAIFDMDGTLIDSMGAWRRLNVAFVRERGIVPSEQEERELLQLSGTKAVDYFMEKYGIQSDFDTVCRAACEAMGPVYAAGVPQKPGAIAYLRRLRARGVKCVVATATPAHLALVALNRAGITPYCDFIYSTEMIGLQKDSASFYDVLCGQIGEANADCVMFEDAAYAMRGARAAGLGVIGVTDATNERDREAIYALCDRVIDAYDELE